MKVKSVLSVIFLILFVFGCTSAPEIADVGDAMVDDQIEDGTPEAGEFDDGLDDAIEELDSVE